VTVPIIGVVAAGQPVFAEENQIGEVQVESQIIRSGEHFALRASGKSMVEADIDNGDLLIVRRQALAENGDIVVALLNSKATVKKLKIRSDSIELVPENKHMKPIPVSPDDDLKILGKVVGVKRQCR
jgi:repressor LexA